jgi:hypothetical protein
MRRRAKRENDLGPPRGVLPSEQVDEGSLAHHRRRCASYDAPILIAGRKHPEITWNLC